jgi:hypothetical protein
MKVPKDIYEYIGSFAADRDILQMLSVNKKFNDPEFFKRAIEKRYPFLLKYKADEISWRQFYVSMIYYVSKMKETFPDFPVEKFDVNEMNKDSLMFEKAIEYALKSNNLPFILYFVNKFALPTGAITLEGFNAPVFIKPSLKAFIENANFGDFRIKQLLAPLLEQGILSRALLSTLLPLYFYFNKLRYDLNGRKLLKVGKDMEKYLDNELGLINNFDRNAFRYSQIQNIISNSIIPKFELTEEQRNLVLSDQNRRLLSALPKVFQIIYQNLE